ncbi:MAG: SNF2-related protein [Firmicutes bacterium]|nr:SNF2-related protein [Bacillota bacterium]
MASIIDNKKKTMLEAFRNELKKTESVDIMTGYFYFSGFNELADELKDKKIRILVGMTIDPKKIGEVSAAVKYSKDICLDSYSIPPYPIRGKSQTMNDYVDSFVGMFNKSILAEEFDDTDSRKVFEMFLQKLIDGSLEIRLASVRKHGKAYVFTYAKEHTGMGVYKGSVIMGSSNFTYNGLVGQGELNEPLNTNEKYEEYKSEFEEQWNDSKAVDINIEGNDDFVKKLKERLYIFAQPSPYSVYARILFELYKPLDNCRVQSPSQITGGKFSNLKYQVDAIKYGVDCVNKNNGVIIADVVGLGKSIIASAIARNLDMDKTVIIVPPHLVDQWEEYNQDFGLRGAKVYSSGKIEEAYKRYAADNQPILYIIDEAHRYRNELSEAYMQLHQLTRSNPDNKVILLTATPYNNRPHDVFALIKLFQSPSRSTIRSVDNLGVSFASLFAEYAKLEKEGKQGRNEIIDEKLKDLSQKLRVLIEPVIVRRSRIDLTEVKEYADDLKAQGVAFPKVVGPKVVEYDLGEIRELYLDTLDKLSVEHTCARYNAANYLNNHAEFMDTYGDFFEATDIRLFQKNLAQFMKRLLVMRFESSKDAFRKTLSSLIDSYENIIKWWDKGFVPIKKAGYLGDPSDMDITDVDEILDAVSDPDNEPLDAAKAKKEGMKFKRELFKTDYIDAVKNDIQLLSAIRDKWFAGGKIGADPKFDEVKSHIDKLQKENKGRKIVIFSSFSDTAEYIKDLLEKHNYRALLYKGGLAKTQRQIVKQNFDASHNAAEQVNDFDIIVATDALSEGFNLNRAGVIINYDIPYNPTRVVQRIGRINRINKKMFDNIFIYNFFPTDIGEGNTRIKGISTLKMLLINNIVGSDTKTLTPDETLESYFKNQYEEADKGSNDKSWDNEYRNTYNAIKHNVELERDAAAIPERVKIVRKGKATDVAISFAKRGDNVLFALAESDSIEAEILPADKVLGFFKADKDEKGFKLDENLDAKFAKLRKAIAKPPSKVKLDKRKGKAIDNVEKLLLLCVAQKNYLTDLIESIRVYDDLSDGELKYLAAIKVKKSDACKVVDKIKELIPEHYLMQIKNKAESIDSITEIIMFTEDLRNAND